MVGPPPRPPRTTARAAPHRASGFSLVEVLVALVLLSVVALGTAGAGQWAEAMLRRAETLEVAAGLAGEVLDSLAMEEAPSDGERTSGRVRLGWSVTLEGELRRVELRFRAPEFLAAEPPLLLMVASPALVVDPRLVETGGDASGEPAAEGP